MTAHPICSSAPTTPASSGAPLGPAAPGLLTGSLSIAADPADFPAGQPYTYELQLTVEQLGAGILRAAIVDVASSEMMPVCMINVQGPIGGPPGTETSTAPGTQYSQSWTQSDVPGVRFGATAALLEVYVYESDSPAVISAAAIF